LGLIGVRSPKRL
jgi:DNA invertase Pin-like site-specific DNA recombinase